MLHCASFLRLRRALLSIRWKISLANQVFTEEDGRELIEIMSHVNVSRHGMINRPHKVQQFPGAMGCSHRGMKLGVKTLYILMSHKRLQPDTIFHDGTNGLIVPHVGEVIGIRQCAVNTLHTALEVHRNGSIIFKDDMSNCRIPARNASPQVHMGHHAGQVTPTL